MRRSRFTESQIIGIVERLWAGESVAELCEEYRISASTVYTWRSRYSGSKPEDIGPLHRIQRENRRLRRVIAGMVEETDKLKGLIRANQSNTPRPANAGSHAYSKTVPDEDRSL